MTPDPGLIEQAVRGGDARRVRELLSGASEAERRACAKALRPLLREPEEPGEVFVRWRELSATSAFVVAAGGLVGGRAAAVRALDGLRGGDHGLSEADYQAIAGVLADRKPPWLADLVDRLLRDQLRYDLVSWQLARRLVRLGVIERPGVPGYAIMMLGGLCVGSGASDPLNALLNDPGLLDDEVWRLFTEPGVGAELDWGAEDWLEALAELAARERLDRGRLLDACLDSFIRDFPPNHVGWYLRMHDRLAPSRDEKAARASRYLALLAALNKPGVTLGQRECGALLDAGLLDPAVFLAASGPALLFPQKSVATAQLKLIDTLAAARPEVRDRALVTAATAFGHQREDVQAKALKLLASRGLPADAGSRAAIDALAAGLSPVLAPDAAALGLAVAPGTGEPWVAGESALSVPDNGLIAPVGEPAELVQLLALLLEDASDAVAVERALAGAVRFASLPLAERARFAAPVLKRAEERTGDAYGVWGYGETESHLAWLTLAWATGRLTVRTYPEWMDEEEPNIWSPPESKPDPADWDPARSAAISAILSARIWEACTAIGAGNAGPLPILAEPEFADGSIGHGQLLDRLARWRPGVSGPPRNDLEVALLRLAPGADESFWARWARLPVVTAGAAPPADEARRRYAEGRATLGFEPVFVAAARHGPLPGQLRQPPRVFARLTSPPDTASSASGCWRVLADPASPEHVVYGGHVGARSYYDMADWPLLCPHQPELVAAHLLKPLSDGLESGRSAATNAVRCLARTGTGPGTSPGTGSGTGRSFREIGHLALVTGLASAEPDTRIAAAGAWTSMSLDGRLDPALAGAAIAFGVTGEVFKLNRVADGLQHATLEAAAAVGVGQAAVAATAALLPARPPGLHLLLEIATRCAATAGPPELPAEITDLARTRDRTKLAEAARRLARL